MPPRHDQRDVPAAVSAVGSQCEGLDYYSGIAPQCTADAPPTELQFNPQWDPAAQPGYADLAYAVYCCKAHELVGPVTLRSEWSTEPPAADLWFGMANFDRQTWDWRQGAIGDKINFGDLGQYLSGDGNVYVAVLLAGTQSSVLTKVYVGDDTPETYSEYHKLYETSYSWESISEPLWVAGCPAFAMARGNGGGSELIFLRAVDRQVSDWNTPVALANVESGQIGLALIGGYPAVAYVSNGTDHFMFRRASNPEGTTWDAAVQVCSDTYTPSTGRTIQLREVDEHPAIVLFTRSVGPNGGGLMYIRADDANGASWPAAGPLQIGGSFAPSQDTYSIPLLTVIDNRPAVAALFKHHADAPEGFDSIRYVYAQDADGTAWNAPLDLEPQPESFTSRWLNLCLLDMGGVPGIGWFIKVHMTPAENRSYFTVGLDAAANGWGDLTQIYPTPTSNTWGTLLRSTFQVVDLTEFGQGKLLYCMGAMNYFDGDFGAEFTIAPIQSDGQVDWLSAVQQRDIGREVSARRSSALKQTSSYSSLDSLYFLADGDPSTEMINFFFLFSGYDHDISDWSLETSARQQSVAQD